MKQFITSVIILLFMIIPHYSFSSEIDLIKAVNNRNISEIKAQIQNGADVNANSDTYFSPLRIACIKKDLKTATFLIKSGANVNMYGLDGMTALMQVASSGDSNLVSLLANNKAELNLRNEESQSALFLSVINENLKATKALIIAGAELNLQDKEGKTPLMIAGITGQYEISKALLKGGADPALKNKKGKTALFIACKYEQLKIIKALINNGADINDTDKYGWTALTSAVDDNHESIVKLLLEYGADINIRNKYGDTILHRSISENRLSIARLLIEKGADINAVNNNNETPLFKASGNDELLFVKLLLNKGADINIRNNKQLSPLMISYKKRHLPILKLLIKKNADLRERDKKGRTIVMNLPNKSGRFFDIAELLLAQGAPVDDVDKEGKTGLFYSIENNAPEFIYLFLQHGADINKRANDGETPLNCAISKKNKEIVELLITEGADINYAGKRGISPLGGALSWKNFEIIKTMISKGADVNAKDGNGDPILTSVIKGFGYQISPRYKPLGDNDPKLTQLLLENGADVNIINYKRTTPFLISVTKSPISLFEKFLSAGGELESRNISGETPLIISARNNDIDRVRLLLKKGADINAIDYMGNTALHNGTDDRKNELIELLLKNNPDLSIKNNADRTPLDIAINNNNDLIIKLLKEKSGTVEHERKKQSPDKPVESIKSYYSKCMRTEDKFLSEKEFKIIADDKTITGKTDIYGFLDVELDGKYNSGRLTLDMSSNRGPYRTTIYFKNAKPSRKHVDFSSLATAGNIEAQYHYGYALKKGYGVKINITESLDWLKKAAEKDHVNAQKLVAQMYESGEGVPKNMNEALYWYQRHINSYYLYYLTRVSPTADIFTLAKKTQSESPEKSLYWYHQIMKKNQTELSYLIWKTYSDGTEKDFSYETAFRSLKKAADSDKNAKYELAGLLIKENRIKEAISCLSRRQADSHAPSKLLYASLIIKGEHIYRDYEKAAKLYQSLSKNGNTKAQYELAKLYHTGKGVPKKHSKAIQLLEKAIASGSDKAKKLLKTVKNYAAKEKDETEEAGLLRVEYEKGKMFEMGIGGKKDLKQALEIYESVAQKGYIPGIYRYAQLEIEDSYPSYKKIIEFLEKAADDDHAPSQYWLATLYNPNIPLQKDDFDKQYLKDKEKSDLHYKKAFQAGNKDAIKHDEILKKYRKAYELFEKNDFKKAQHAFEKILKLETSPGLKFNSYYHLYFCSLINKNNKATFYKTEFKRFKENYSNSYSLDFELDDALYTEVKSGDCHYIQALLKAGANPQSTKNTRWGKTILMLAAEEGHTEIVKLMTGNKNINLDKLDDYQYSALGRAASANHLDIVKILVEAGADYNQALDKFKDWAVTKHKDIIKYLIEKRVAGFNFENTKETEKLLLIAASYDCINIMKIIFSKSPQILKNCKISEKILYLVASMGDISSVKFFVEKFRADLYIKNFKQSLAVIYASSAGNYNVLEYLIEKGIDINSKDHRNFTPLFYAVSNNAPKSVEYLLKRGADMNIIIDENKTLYDIRNELKPEIRDLFEKYKK